MIDGTIVLGAVLGALPILFIISKVYEFYEDIRHHLWKVEWEKKNESKI